ncbi:MAG: hypothetical protein WC881_06010 [Elusimicrobiota bacterium]|jgi:hypothetical protein
MSGPSRAGLAYSVMLFWAAAAQAAAPEPQCPRGMRLIYTGNPYKPLQCTAPGQKPQDPLPAASPRHAINAEPQPTPRPDGAGRAEWAAESYPGESEEDVLAPSLGVQIRRAPEEAPEAAYRGYRLPGDAAFDIPEDWRLKSVWSGDAPTLTLVKGRPGRQAVITIRRYDASQAGFHDLGIALLKELEWSSGQEEDRGPVGGLAARFVHAKGSSLSAFVSEREDRYFRLNYSASPKVYDAYLPVFERLLGTFRTLDADSIK